MTQLARSRVLGARSAGVIAAFGAALLALPATLGAQPATSASGSASLTAPAGGAGSDELPLAPLPKLPDIKLPAATPEAVQALDARLAQLVGTKVTDPVEPKADLRFLVGDVGPNLVSAIAARFDEMRAHFDGKKALDLLEKARELGRKALKKRHVKDDEEGDWLQFLLALGKRDNEVWQGSVELYGMLRVLEAIGTTPAVRVMVESFSYFGELVRVDLQRAFARLKERAVPALIEAKQHDAKKVAQYAPKWLAALGKAIPGEALQTTEPEVLADVLRAFGRVRDVEALGPVLSFCNSERIALRQAAREAIAAVGKPAEWELESAYQAVTGQNAPKDWSWDRTARELFRLYDKARLEHVYKLMEEGVAAQAAKRWADAVAAFDKVLAFLPLFERRADMAPAYWGRADELLAEDKRDEALELLRKGLRLAPKAASAPHAAARVAYLEAKALADAGTPDAALIRHALELDPEYAPARELLGSLDEKAVERQQRSQRTIYGIGIGVAALAALVLLARRPRPKRKKIAPPAEPPRPAPAPEPSRADPEQDQPLADSGLTRSTGEAPPASLERDHDPREVHEARIAPTLDMASRSDEAHGPADGHARAEHSEHTTPWSGASAVGEPAAFLTTEPLASDAAPTLHRPATDAAPPTVLAHPAADAPVPSGPPLANLVPHRPLATALDAPPSAGLDADASAVLDAPPSVGLDADASANSPAAADEATATPAASTVRVPPAPK